jgi:hypothetical protein
MKHVRRMRKKEQHQVLVLETSLSILSDVFGGYFNYSCLTSLYPFAVVYIDSYRAYYTRVAAPQRVL